MKQIYKYYDSLESCFLDKYSIKDLQKGIHHFKTEFLSFGAPKRTAKHISDPHKNSAAKRLNMMLRWFVQLVMLVGIFCPRELGTQLFVALNAI